MIDILEFIEVPLVFDDELELAPNVVQPLFIVTLGTVTLVLVAPLYKVLVTEPSAVVQPLALKVTVTSFLQLRYLSTDVCVCPIPVIVIELPAAVP